MIKTKSKIFCFFISMAIILIFLSYRHFDNKYLHVNETLSADINYKVDIDEASYNKIMNDFYESAHGIGIEFVQTRIITSLKDNDEEQIICVYAKSLLCAIKSKEPAKCNKPTKKIHKFFLEKTKEYAAQMTCK